MTESCRLVTTEQLKEYKKAVSENDELKTENNNLLNDIVDLHLAVEHWHKEAERISHEAIGARLEVITLQKKLDIAVKVLEHYRDSDWWWEAKEALKEIEEVK